MAGQHTAVNTFPGLVHTARHTMRVGNTRSPQSNRKEGAAEGGPDNWGEVVTRQPYRKVRLDHLLSKEKERGFEDIFSKENVYDFEKEVFFLLKEEVCYLFFNVF